MVTANFHSSEQEPDIKCNMEWENELFRGAHFNVIDATCSCKQTLRSMLGHLARGHARFVQIGRLILKHLLENPTKLLIYVKILYPKALKPEFGAT